jgi:hypothetical protein
MGMARHIIVSCLTDLADFKKIRLINPGGKGEKAKGGKGKRTA